jgi:hypothetical protein
MKLPDIPEEVVKRNLSELEFIVYLILKDKEKKATQSGNAEISNAACNSNTNGGITNA